MNIIPCCTISPQTPFKTAEFLRIFISNYTLLVDMVRGWKPLNGDKLFQSSIMLRKIRIAKCQRNSCFYPRGTGRKAVSKHRKIDSFSISHSLPQKLLKKVSTLIKLMSVVQRMKDWHAVLWDMPSLISGTSLSFVHSAFQCENVNSCSCTCSMYFTLICALTRGTESTAWKRGVRIIHFGCKLDELVQWQHEFPRIINALQTCNNMSLY